MDGCDLESEPGYEHMEWLRIQLEFLRQRGMKAILTGHVPPARTESKQSWDESCYQKYTLWMRQYRDVVIFSTFGHMNIDHFMFQDVKDLRYKFKIKGIKGGSTRSKEFEAESNAENFTIAAKATYLNELRNEWSELPSPPPGYTYGLSTAQEELDTEVKEKKKKKDEEKEYRKFLKAIGGQWGERFSLSLVSPSVVPNFFPTLRIVEYNITGLQDHHPAVGVIGTPAEVADVPADEGLEDAFSDDDEQAELAEDPSEDMHDMKKKKKKKGKKKKHKKKPNFPVPKPPSKSAPPGPGYSPQPLSPISYTQLYANLTKIYEEIEKDKKGTDPDRHFQYHVEYTTNDDMYGLKDLTVRSWLDLAERIGRDTLPKSEMDSVEDVTPQKHEKKKSKTAKNHLWKTFIKRAFVHTKADEEIEQDFG